MRVSTMGLHNLNVSRMLAQQSELARTQEQVSSQQRFRTAGENPTGMAQVLSLESAQAAHARLADNAGSLRHRLSSEESALDAIDDTLNRVRELAVQANSAALTSADRSQIASEMEQQYARLVDLANSDDGTGRYLFAGTQDGAPPFASGAGGVSYHGDQQSRRLAVGSGAQMSDGDSGDAVFLRLDRGPQAQLAADNTGTLAVGTVTASSGSAAALTLTFTGGQYEARDGSGTLVQSGSYSAGETIELPGLRLKLSGTPADGDSLSLGAGGNQDLFARVRSLIDASTTLGAGTAAERAQSLSRYNQALGGLDGGMNHLSTVRASVGTRLATLDDVDDQLGALDIQLQSTLSDVRDLDYAEAISRLQLQTTSLQAAQAVFAKVQGLSLFNYLR